MDSDFGQLTAIVVITMAAFRLIETLINKYTGNGSKGINDNINKLRDNHFHELQNTLNKIDARTEQLVNKMDILIERLRK